MKHVLKKQYHTHTVMCYQIKRKLVKKKSTNIYLPYSQDHANYAATCTFPIPNLYIKMLQAHILHVCMNDH